MSETKSTSPWSVDVSETTKRTLVLIQHGALCVGAVYLYPPEFSDRGAAANELHDRLTSPLLAPLPEGVEWVMRAPAARVRELGWEWLHINGAWYPSTGLPVEATAKMVCRPPLPPQVTVGDSTLPADASDDDIVAAFRAAGGVS